MAKLKKLIIACDGGAASGKSTAAKLISKKYKLLLINSGSASASEIVSGAIQDMDRGVIIGQKSYGKGLVQQTRELSYNAKLKLTVAKYYLPSGESISEVGVSPDIEIDEDSDEFRIKTDTDNQLNYAIKLLNG